MSDEARLAALLDTAVEQAQRDPSLRTALTPTFERIAGLVTGEPGTPSKRKNPRITLGDDKWDQLGYTRGSFELAYMLMDGAGKMRNAPCRVEPSQEFMDAYRARVAEAGPRPYVVDGEGRFVRAMDTLESGYGAELIGVAYAEEMWAGAKNEDGLVGDIRSVDMRYPSMYVPIDGDLPPMLLAGESVLEGATPYGTSKTPTSRVLLTAKKFTIQQVWSGELNEDSVVAFTPFLQDQIQKSAAVHLGSAFLNGDTTDAGADSNNINYDAGDLDANEHFLAWDGIRHYWLVTTAAQGKDMAGVLNPDEIWKCRGRLSAQAAITKGGIKAINWGKNVRDLRLVCDFDSFMGLHRLGEVLTVDKYGPAATVVTGELGSFGGIPIISPPYAGKTLASGFIGSTEGNNTKGQITVFNPKGWLAGRQRQVQLYFDRIQRTDQFLLELYTRVAFTRFGAGVAAGIFDITV